MAHNCKNCKFHDIDYEWDDNIGDEANEEICSKHHNIFLHLPIKCPYFKKYKPKPYVEKFNECDTCEYVNQCEADGYILEYTTLHDNHRHFIKGRVCYCRKENVDGCVAEIENNTSKSVFVIDTLRDCLHCPMRACLHINDKHYQLCGLQIPHYGWGTEAFFKDEDLKENWISPKCPLISDKEFIRNLEI